MATIERSSALAHYVSLHAEAAIALSVRAAAFRNLSREATYGEAKKAFAAVSVASRRENDARILVAGARNLLGE